MSFFVCNYKFFFPFVPYTSGSNIYLASVAVLSRVVVVAVVGCCASNDVLMAMTVVVVVFRCCRFGCCR